MRVAEPEMMAAVARVYAEEILAETAFISDFQLTNPIIGRGQTRVRFTDGTCFTFAVATDLFHLQLAGEHVARFFRDSMPYEIQLGALLPTTDSDNPFFGSARTPPVALTRAIAALNSLAANSAPREKDTPEKPPRRLPPTSMEADAIRDAVVMLYRNPNAVLKHITSFDTWAVVMPGNGEIQTGSGAFIILNAVTRAGTLALRMQEEDDAKVRAAAAGRKRRRRIMS